MSLKFSFKLFTHKLSAGRFNHEKIAWVCIIGTGFNTDRGDGRVRRQPEHKSNTNHCSRISQLCILGQYPISIR
jgi:hypothetical protein